MASDPALLAAARKQLEHCRDDPAAFLGWWAAWKDQADVDRDDLVDLVKAAGHHQPPLVSDPQLASQEARDLEDVDRAKLGIEP